MRVDFDCVSCGRLLHTSRKLQKDGTWPKSYKWSCHGCPDNYHYVLFLRLNLLRYSVCSHNADWSVIPNVLALSVPFHVDGPRFSGDDYSGQTDDAMGLFLQRCALATVQLLPALLGSLQPIDIVAAAALNAELTASLRTGAIHDNATVGFADDGARSGYVSKSFTTRCRYIGAAALSSPAVVSLLSGDRSLLRVASIGGGPGECALALAVCRQTFDMQATIQLQLAIFDLEPGWRSCVEHVAAEMRASNMLEAADEVWFATADVTQSLDHAANRAISPAAEWDLIVFSYVLAENARGVRDGDFAMLRGLFANMRPGACCMVLDASEQLHEDLLNLARSYGLQASQLTRSYTAGRSCLPRNCIIISQAET